jgi:hypothetical protein
VGLQGVLNSTVTLKGTTTSASGLVLELFGLSFCGWLATYAMTVLEECYFVVKSYENFSTRANSLKNDRLKNRSYLCSVSYQTHERELQQP